MRSLAIVPAAGKGERFGGGKLLADINGEPLLNHTLRSLLDGGVARVVAVLPPDAAFESVALLADPRVMRVINPDPSRGMFSSIQAGVAAAEGDPILVLPADMPFVKSTTVAAVLAAARQSGQIISPRFRGRHGHPVSVPASIRSAMLAADPASTLAMLIDKHAGTRAEVDVDDPGVRRDVDAPSDLG
jgi:molybdenum cofactor cytidylyltransferase